jgi:hypothetical protein
LGFLKPFLATELRRAERDYPRFEVYMKETHERLKSKTRNRISEVRFVTLHQHQHVLAAQQPLADMGGGRDH